LRDVVVNFETGRTVLLGPNGAGKSTLLKAIAGVLPFEGSLTLDDATVEPSRRKRPRTFRTAVGWLPQGVIPFAALTVREHVAYLGWLKGLSTKDAWSRAIDALAEVGLDSKASEKADQLSGGQMRRLGIAGVLVHNAHYLLLDEPTAGLDPRERDRLVGVLQSLERTRSVVVSTHDTAGLIDEHSKVLVLAGGQLRFSGTYAEFTGSYPGSPEHRVQQAYAEFVPED